MTRVAFGFGTDDSNTHIYNLLNLVTSLGVSFYFYLLLQSRLKKGIALLSGIITLLYYIVNIKEIYLDSVGHVIASTGIVVLIFLYLHQVMSNVTDEPLSGNFDFWYVCTQLTYHLGSFAIFLSYNYFSHVHAVSGEDKAEIGTILTYLWVVHNVILILGALTICFGAAWIYRRKLPLS